MTRAIYVVGGSATGKSTFVADLIASLDLTYGPLVEVHELRNPKALVKLRGRFLPPSNGFYLGELRENFPGTDALDLVSMKVGEDWVRTCELPEFVISEGQRFSTKLFLTGLAENTDFLLVHLHVEPFIAELRSLSRGSSNHTDRFVRATITQANNSLKLVQGLGSATHSFDSGDNDAWADALQLCRDWVTLL